jgi:hypothetical protein
VRTFGVFLEAKEVGFEADVQARKPLSPQRSQEAVFLCHALYVTLLEEQLIGACLGSGAREPLGIGSLGLVF